MKEESGARKAYRLLTGNEPLIDKEPDYDSRILWIFLACVFIFLITILLTILPTKVHAESHNKITVVFKADCLPVIGYTCDQLADAIYLAEGGRNTKHPYGIMKKYKKTSPRKACLNTIKSGVIRWLKTDQTEDFIVFLGRTYSPPDINPDWVGNVKALLKKGSKRENIKA